MLVYKFHYKIANFKKKGLWVPNALSLFSFLQAKFDIDFAKSASKPLVRFQAQCYHRFA